MIHVIAVIAKQTHHAKVMPGNMPPQSPPPSEVLDSTLPILGCALAIIAWGSFAAPMKSEKIAAAKLDPVVFQLYMCIGIYLASLQLLLLPNVRHCFEWTWWAVLSAALWVPGNLMSVIAVKELGIALGQGVWSGTVALVSFLWGQLYFQAGMKNPVLGVLGICFLVCGIAALGLISGGDAPDMASSGALVGQHAPLIPGDMAMGAVVADTPLVTKAAPRHRIRGLCAALAVGLCAGSTMVPLRLAPERPFRNGVDALSFAVCFAIAVVPVSLAVVGLYAACRRAVPPLHVESCLLPATLSGALWAVGNAGGVLATLPPLGLTVGYPSTQACLIVSGLWGIFYFGEVKGAQRISSFFCAALVVVGGAALLGVFGQAS